MNVPEMISEAIIGTNVTRQGERVLSGSLAVVRPDERHLDSSVSDSVICRTGSTN